MNRFKRKSNEPVEQMIILSQPEASALPNFDLGSSYFEESDPRVIWLPTEVYPETVHSVIQQINSINYLDDKKEKEAAVEGQTYVRHPIKLHISSYGGSVYDGFGLVGVMQRSKTPIHTYAVGKVMSMGFVLAIAGHRRFAYPHTTYMFHSLSSAHYGKFAELKESVEEDERLQDKIDALTLQLTSIDEGSLQDVHSRKLDWYFDAVDALDLGCVDEIV